VILGAGGLVEDAIGWAMGHKDVCISGDTRVELRSIPVRDNSKSFAKERSCWRPPYLLPHDFDSFVNQERGVRDQLASG
jgi:hypothetical protein